MKLTDKTFWESYYGKKRKPRIVQKSGYGIIEKHLIEIFKEILKQGSHLSYLELGCGDSRWIIYFKKFYGYEVWGVDYSDAGIKLIKDRLRFENIKANIVKNDFTKLGENFSEKFDIVSSFGVIEHFEDYNEIIKVFSSFLKKDGLLITGVPKLTGIQGKIQKVLDEEVFNKHIIIDKKDLKKVYEKNNLEVLELREIGLISLGYNFRKRKLLKKIYRYYNWLGNRTMKWLLPFKIVDSLKIGSYFVVIGRKK